MRSLSFGLGVAPAVVLAATLGVSLVACGEPATDRASRLEAERDVPPQLAHPDPGLFDRPTLVVLGVAQDGGIPQAGHAPVAGKSESRRELVVSLGLVTPRDGEPDARYLFEATPDFREQLALLDELTPRSDEPGLEGIFLTHAHMGHYTGLMFLGFESIGAKSTPVYAMPKMADYLRNNGPWSQLVRYNNIELQNLSAGSSVGLTGGVSVTPFLVPHRQEFSEVVGYRIEGPTASALFIPDINSWEEWDAEGTRIEEVLKTVDRAYLDGCFWDHGEVPGRDMSGFPHPLMRETMTRLQTLPADEKSKVKFLHLNHSNPAGLESSRERAEVLALGFGLAQQGERFGL